MPGQQCPRSQNERLPPTSFDEVESFNKIYTTKRHEAVTTLKITVELLFGKKLGNIIKLEFARYWLKI